MVSRLNWKLDPSLQLQKSGAAPEHGFREFLTQRQLRYIEWMGVKIYDFQKVTISTLFKLYNAGLGVLIPKRYHMWG